MGKFLLGAWAVPGGGHWLLGRRTKGFTLCVLILTTYFSGLLICHWQGNSPFGDPLLYTCHVLMGLFGIVSYFLHHYNNFFHSPFPLPFFSSDLGSLFILTAAFLHALSILKVYSLVSEVEEVLQKDKD